MTGDLVKRLPQLSDEEKTARALAACDELAETWAIEADLPDMAIAVAGKPDADSRIVALAKQAFIEGAYRAFCQRQDAIDQLVEAQAVIERLTTERDNAWNGAIDQMIEYLSRLAAYHKTPEHFQQNAKYLFIEEILAEARRIRALKPEWRPTHRHYKGGLYRVLFDATHSETEELMTIYQTPDGRQWARPSAMFNETLPDGRKRFEAIAGGE